MSAYWWSVSYTFGNLYCPDHRPFPVRFLVLCWERRFYTSIVRFSTIMLSVVHLVPDSISYSKPFYGSHLIQLQPAILHC